MPGALTPGKQNKKKSDVTIMTNLSTAPTIEPKSFRTNHSQPSKKNKPLQGVTFYPLTQEEWLDISEKLTMAEARVLYYLRTSSPFGDRPIELSVRDLARTLNLGASTVSRALKHLNDCQYIDLRALNLNFRVLPQGLHTTRLDKKLEQIEGQEESGLKLVEETRSQQAELTLPSVITHQAQCLSDECSVPIQAEVFQDWNTHPPEFKPGQGFGLLKTNQTLNTKERETEKAISPDSEVPSQQTTNELQASAAGWQNFVAPGNDPEFFAFVVRRTAKLPQPPADAQCAAEGWIRKQGHILYPQYVAWKARQTVLAEPPPTSAPPATDLPELTLAQRLAKYQTLWQIPTCRRGIRAMIVAHPEWGLQIGKAGPEIIGEKAAIAC